MHWKAATVLICIYGVVKEFRPGTPFLTPFLVSEFKNLTKEAVYGDIYPVWTYSYLAFMAPIFFLTDILRYKPVVVLEALTLSCTWALLVWGQGVRAMQFMQICFGLSSAAEIAYYSYMFAMVDERNYKRISSYIRSSAMIGKLVAFALAQYLVSTHKGSYLLLNEISFVSVSLVTIIAFFLPSVPAVKVDKQVRVRAVGGTLTEKREEEGLAIDEEEPLSDDGARADKLASGVRLYFSLTLRSLLIYRDSSSVLKWSIWWAVAACGYYQITNYAQSLWIFMQKDTDDVQNGLVEIANTIVGALLSFLMQYLSIDWKRWGMPTLAFSSAIIAILQLLSAQTDKLIVAYSCYIATCSIYHMLITAACANIATLLTAANYGLVFGVNTFAALILQSALTFAVTDSHGLGLDMRQQFFVYSAYFGFVAAMFFAFVIHNCFKSKAPVVLTISNTIDDSAQPTG